MTHYLKTQIHEREQCRNLSAQSLTKIDFFCMTLNNSAYKQASTL